MTEALPHVLFLCTENACRSQMAEAWLRHLGEGRIRVSSAGVRPGVINPSTLVAMDEVGVSTDGQRSKDVSGVDVDTITHVVTVCDRAEEQCPVFPGEVVRIHWSVPDPAAMVKEFPSLVNDGFRAVRDNLRDRVSLLVMQFQRGEIPNAGNR